MSADVELRQLRYFLAVAEEKHFGRAAARLMIAQPGLSQQIKRFERSIGAELFIRDKRRVELTKAGEVLVDYARQVIGVAERAVENARAAVDGKLGLLKLGGYSIAVYPEATVVLREFETRFPNVRVDFQPAHAMPSFEALIRRTVDIVIALAPFDRFAPDVRFQRLGAIEPLIAMASGHRLAAFDRIPQAELRNEAIITWPREINARLYDHVFATVFGDRPPERIVEVTDRLEILVRAAAGEGVALATPAVLRLDMANLEFRRLDYESAAFDYGLVWLESGVSPYVTDFVDIAREMTAGLEGAGDDHA
jgi:DNA-binding transcriptional LysR family regulator